MPASLVGADISQTALEIAARRVKLHPGADRTTVVRVGEGGDIIDADEQSFDYVHCSGVLHHVDDPNAVLREFKRLLAPAGRIRLMLYNRNSIWRNFYVPFVLQHRRRAIDPRLPVDEVFRMSTDGPDCPIARTYDMRSISALAAASGLRSEWIGTSISQHELRIWKEYRGIALRSRRTDPAVRAFVESVDTDSDGLPVDVDRGRPGINLVVELTHAADS